MDRPADSRLSFSSSPGRVTDAYPMFRNRARESAVRAKVQTHQPMRKAPSSVCGRA